jgi:hypothetical protein
MTSSSFLEIMAGPPGGIYETTDAGVHWQAIFDEQPVQSIDSLAVAGIWGDRLLNPRVTAKKRIEHRITVGHRISRFGD